MGEGVTKMNLEESCKQQLEKARALLRTTVTTFASAVKDWEAAPAKHHDRADRCRDDVLDALLGCFAPFWMTGLLKNDEKIGLRGSAAGVHIIWHDEPKELRARFRAPDSGEDVLTSNGILIRVGWRIDELFLIVAERLGELDRKPGSKPRFADLIVDLDEHRRGALTEACAKFNVS
jgi:hypothetical protein